MTTQQTTQTIMISVPQHNGGLQPLHHQTTIEEDVDAGTYRKLGCYAKRRGLSVGQAAVECLRAYLPQLKPQPATGEVPAQQPTK